MEWESIPYNTLRINSFVDNDTIFLFNLFINQKTLEIYGIKYDIYYTDSYDNKINRLTKDEYLNTFDKELSQLLIGEKVDIDQINS